MPREPVGEIGAAHARLGTLEEFGVGARVAVADGVDVVEVFEGVFADGLEHAEPAAVAGQQAVVGERGDAVQGVGAADGFGGLKREAAGEHAELGEQALLRLRPAGRSSSRSRL